MTCSCRDMTTTKRMQDLFSSGRGDPQRNLPRGRINKTLTLPLSDLPPHFQHRLSVPLTQGHATAPHNHPIRLASLALGSRARRAPRQIENSFTPETRGLVAASRPALSPARLENQSRGRFASLVSSFVALGVRSGGWKSMMRGSDSARQVRRPSSAGNV